jgi:Leu/Phe-tRNA-protein transferase
VNLGQDWLRARFRHMFVLATMAAEFSWVSSNGRCTWRRISLPGGDRLIGLPPHTKKNKTKRGLTKRTFRIRVNTNFQKIIKKSILVMVKKRFLFYFILLLLLFLTFQTK